MNEKEHYIVIKPNSTISMFGVRIDIKSDGVDSSNDFAVIFAPFDETRTKEVLYSCGFSKNGLDELANKFYAAEIIDRKTAVLRCPS